ncbi:trehalase-like domain-containing protein [Paenarthrobacter sp. RAF54_2]|uniref:trehalase-like domain-containing protein n=1 Tax=Paenarthrobacter sp. RAF54_2 TaxID=3233061 RepID=UPI003F970259
MAAPIEHYALLADLQTGPLVSRNGSVDWLYFPRFDSPWLFCALVGTGDHGRWLLAPSHGGAAVVDRRYLDSTFVLQTTWETITGRVLIRDFMPVGLDRSSLLRRIMGLYGTVEMHQELIIRPSYGLVMPWVSRGHDHADPGATVLVAMAGPDAIALRGPHIPPAYAHQGVVLPVDGGVSMSSSPPTANTTSSIILASRGPSRTWCLSSEVPTLF